MTGDGPGLDMSLSTSSWAGSGCGSWYSSIDEYWQVCWLHGIGGVGGLGIVVHCGACRGSTSTGGASDGKD